MNLPNFSLQFKWNEYMLHLEIQEKSYLQWRELIKGWVEGGEVLHFLLVCTELHNNNLYFYTWSRLHLIEFHNLTWFVYTIRLVLYLQKKSSLGFVTRFDPSLLKQKRVRNNHQENIGKNYNGNKQLWILWQSYIWRKIVGNSLEGGIKWLSRII